MNHAQRSPFLVRHHPASLSRAHRLGTGAEEATEILHRRLQQGAAHLTLLAAMLADGQHFLPGERPSAADLAAYRPVWMLKTRVGEKAEALLPLQPLTASKRQ